MKVTINSNTFFIDWKHTAERKVNRKLSKIYATERPETTTAILRDSTNKVVTEATVYKHPKDAPNRRLARKYSLRKLIETTGIGFADRAVIWNEFFKLTPKNKI